MIDFTTWTDEQLKSYFKNLPQNTCGRFKAAQLTTYTLEEPQGKGLKWLSAAVVSALLAFGSKDGFAQDRQKQLAPTEQWMPNSLHPLSARPSLITIKGTVSDNLGQPLPGANVLVPGTKISTTADMNGSFSIEIKPPGDTVALEFSFIGFLSDTRKIPVTEWEVPIVMVMAVDEVALSEVVYVGGCSTRWFSPRNFWWKLKGLFRR